MANLNSLISMASNLLSKSQKEKVKNVTADKVAAAKPLIESAKKSSSGGGGGSSSSSSKEPTINNGPRAGVYEPSNAATRNNVEYSGTKGTSTDYGTYEDDLKKLTEAQKQAQISQLKAARTKALANLDAQEQAIKPTYQNARNMTSATSQQGARNLAEYLANRGLTNSGASAQAEINRTSALNNNLGNINVAEANAYRDIANQRTAIENDYVSGLANANNALTANYYNNLLNYNQNQRQMIQNLQNQANYQYYDNIQAQIDNLLAQGYSPNSYEVLSLQALRGNKVANQYNSGMSNAMNNVLAGNINYNNAAQLGMTVPQAQNLYTTTEAQKAAAAQKALEDELYNRQLAEDKIQRDIEQQNFDNNMDYNNYLLNAAKVANDTALTNYKISEPKVVYRSSGNKNNNPSNDNYLSSKQIESVLNQYTNKTDKLNALNNMASGMSEDDYITYRLLIDNGV